MKKFSFPKRQEKIANNRISSQGGMYSLTMTIIVLAILIAVNILVSALPKAMTNLDMSSTKLYSITSNTKVVVNALKKDVTIYWIVQAGEEDDVMENLLSKYDSLSDHIEVVKKNPDIYPTFAANYTSEIVENNSLVVECGDTYRFISIDDIYISEYDSYTYESSNWFDGEGAITSAIDYVVSEDLPTVYLLEGHGEAELPSTFAKQIEKANVATDSFSLLKTGAVPEDADAVLIYAPTTDLSAEESDLLSKYVEEGGKLMVVAGLTEEGTLVNLYDILADYEMKPAEGLAIETVQEYYAYGYPYVLLPTYGDSEITASLVENNYYVLMPLAQGIIDYGTVNATVTPLLSTSSTAYSKVDGFDITTYEKEEGDIQGGFYLGVSVALENEGQIIWYTSADFLEDAYNSYSSGANVELAMNSLSALIGESEAIAIQSKSLDYNYLTISDSVSSVLKTVMIGICPIIYLGVGIVVVIRRRKENEAN